LNMVELLPSYTSASQPENGLTQDVCHPTSTAKQKTSPTGEVCSASRTPARETSRQESLAGVGG